MRKYDVAYVPNGPVSYYPAKPLEDMTLGEIKKKYIAMCGKANGDISVCSKCQTPCREGKRAIQLVANEVYNDPPIPLYGGKTLIERAREENIKRRKEMEEIEKQETAEKPKKKTRSEVPFDGWYDVAMNSGDPIKWLMDTMNITKTQAKKKLYQYKYYKSQTEAKENKVKIEMQNEVKVKDEETKTEIKVKIQNDSIEAKLESLMKLQEQHKKAMDEYMRLYNEAKKEYDKIKEKTDILCNAMDILND